MDQRGHDAYYPPPVPVPVGGRHAGDFLDNGSIRTLFVAGLPDDVKAREIHNLFRRRPGFDSCQLKYTGRGNQVVAFATFFNHQSAIVAMHSLNGVKFDPQTNSTLHIELAKTNSRRKSGAGSGPYVVIDNRPKDKSNERATSGDDESEEEAPSEYEDPSEEEDPSSDSIDPSKEEDGNCGSKSDLVKSSETAGNGSTMAGGDSVPRAGNEAIDGDHKPCSTLFIANLGPSCSMEELEQVLSQYPGFVAVRMRARGGTPLAFADFEEIKQATKAMEGLQGMLLASSDRKGMSIEYARSKMRKQAPQQGHGFTLRI